MLTKQELLKYVNEDYTINEVLQETSYTRSQITYACKKFDLKLKSKRQSFDVDPNKVKALLEAGFKVPEIAKILKVNNRCLYNLMYRKKWTKPRMYPKTRKSRQNTNYGYKINLYDIIDIVCVDNETVTMTLKEFLECQDINEYSNKIKYFVIKK